MKPFNINAHLPKLFNWNDLGPDGRRLALRILGFNAIYIWNQWDTLTPAIRLGLHSLGAINPMPAAECTMEPV